MNEMPSNEPYSEPAKMQPTNGRFRSLVWGGTAVAVLFLALAALVLWLDPFGWSVIDRLSGKYDAALTAVPQDSFIYVGVNLVNGNVEDMKALRDTFATPLAEADVNLDEAQQELTDMLAEKYDISFVDDVQPWLGQYLGFALIDLDFDEYGQPENPTWLLIAETRNGTTSDAFLAKVTAAWTKETDLSATTEDYNGVTLTSFVSEQPEEQIALARSGRMVLIAATADVLKQAIDAQKGNSLADRVDYQDAVAELPKDRAVTVYMDGAILADIFDKMRTGMVGLATMSATSTFPTNEVKSMVGSLTFVNEGLQFDNVNIVNFDKLSDSQRALFAAQTSVAPSLTLYPEDTFMYIGAQGAGNIWEMYREVLIAQMGDPEAYDEAMALFARDFGINPDTDFFPYLGNEVAMGLMPGDNGMLAALDVPMNIVVLLGINQEDALAASLDTLTTKLTDPQAGMGTANRVESDGLVLYEFTSPFDESFQFTYGTGRDYLYLATGTAAIQGLQFGGGPSLADNANYRAAAAAFPEGMTPLVYLDLHSLMDTIRTGFAANNDDMTEFDQVAAVLYPLHTIAAATRIDGNMTHQTTIFFIEK